MDTQPTPQGRPPRLEVYVTDEVAQRVDAVRVRTGESRSSWLRRLVLNAVGEPPAEGVTPRGAT